MRKLARKLERHFKSLDAGQLDRLFYKDLGRNNLVTEHITQESPLEFVFVGIFVAFATAVILSGGNLEIPGILKVELPIPLGEGIKKLHQGLPSRRKARASAELNGRLGNVIKRLRRILAPRKKARIGYGVRWTQVKLSKRELNELNKVDPAEYGRGGFQRLLVRLQQRVNPRTKLLELKGDDIDFIFRYGNRPDRGGFQSRIRKIFEKHFEFDDDA